MVTKKDRRNSGRKEARLLIPIPLYTDPMMGPTWFWSDWDDWRDGMRLGKVKEEKLVRPHKVMKQKKIRQARKNK